MCALQIFIIIIIIINKQRMTLFSCNKCVTITRKYSQLKLSLTDSMSTLLSRLAILNIQIETLSSPNEDTNRLLTNTIKNFDVALYVGNLLFYGLGLATEVDNF